MYPSLLTFGPTSFGLAGRNLYKSITTGFIHLCVDRQILGLKKLGKMTSILSHTSKFIHLGFLACKMDACRKKRSASVWLNGFQGSKMAHSLSETRGSYANSD